MLGCPLRHRLRRAARFEQRIPISDKMEMRRASDTLLLLIEKNVIL